MYFVTTKKEICLLSQKHFVCKQKRRTGPVRSVRRADAERTHGCRWTNTDYCTTCDLSFTGQSLSPSFHQATL